MFPYSKNVIGISLKKYRLVSITSLVRKLLVKIGGCHFCLLRKAGTDLESAGLCRRAYLANLTFFEELIKKIGE